MSTTSCLSPWPSVIIDQRPTLARGAAASCSWRMQQREALNKNVSNSTSSATHLNGNLPLVPRLNPNYRSSSSEHNLVSSLARERKASIHQLNSCSIARERKHGILIELAKLDCDYTQSLYQKELWEVSKWWKGLGLAEELGFIRDQVLVWFMFPLSMLPEPHLSDCRLKLAKIVALIYTIDDIYDWATLTQAYIEEAMWQKARFMPKTEEYLRNRVVSTRLPAALVHVYYLMGFSEPKHGPVDALHQRQGLVWYSAMILRLWDDLGSTMDEQERGYDASYIECNMKEFGRRLNRECLVLPTNPNPFPPSFARVALNAARACPVMYQCEKDGRLLDLEGHIKMLVVDRI
ncbi:hypothetical protein EJ110_NYTH55600 [Nymphaea thermarum]|nr:hypothetical protein EJ110_NYTH55600 [Nymphaea thermarum]